MSEVKVGQRWRWESPGIEFRIIAIIGNMVATDYGRSYQLAELQRLAELIPCRDGEYVAGEAVEFFGWWNESRRESLWQAATYVQPLLDVQQHVITEGYDTYLVLPTADLRRPQPRKKWVVPTQADLDRAEEPISCRAKQSESEFWRTGWLLAGILRFHDHPFCVVEPRRHSVVSQAAVCEIQVPADDPREGTEK